MNLIGTFLQQAAANPDKVAIIDGQGRPITYGELAARSASVAAAWRRKGLKRGDRALLAMGLGIDLYVSLAALWRIGAVAVLPEPALGLKGLRHAARTTAPAAYLSSGWYRGLGWILPELRRLPLKLTPAERSVADELAAPVDADHPALISFTSGSSGAPKAIVRSHGLLAAQNGALLSLLEPEGGRAVDLVAFPAFIIANLGLGITSVLPNWNLRHHDEADPTAIARHMRAHGVTRALLPPSICEKLTQAPQLPPLTTIFTGGGPVFPDLLERLVARLPQTDIVAVYGSTEAEPIAHLHVRDITGDDWQAMRQGHGLLAGTPVPEIALRFRDDEILVTGDHVNKGYLGSRQDGDNKLSLDNRIWHRTGDAGYLDGNGRLWLLGRHAARIGGLYPFTVEVAARSWPGVDKAALVAVSDRAVLAIEGDRSLLAQWRDNAAHVADVESGPVEVVPVDAIPLDPRHRSKVDYAALRSKLVTRC